MNKFYTKIERKDGTFSIIKSDGQDNFVESLRSLATANILQATDKATKLNLKKQPIALTYMEQMILKQYKPLLKQVAPACITSDKVRIDADDFAHTLTKADISAEDRAEFYAMLKEWTLCHHSDYINNLVNWLDNLLNKYDVKANLIHLERIVEEYDCSDADEDGLQQQFINALADIYGRPNKQGYILRREDETYNAIANKIFLELQVCGCDMIDICEEFRHSPLSAMSHTRQALINAKCEDKALLLKLKELDRIERDNDNYEILTRVTDLIKAKDKAMTTKNNSGKELYDGFNERTVKETINVIRDYGHFSPKCASLHHNDGALRLKMLGRELNDMYPIDVTAYLYSLLQDIRNHTSDKDFADDKRLINGTSKGLFVLAEDLLAINSIEADTFARKYMAIRPRWDNCEMVTKIVKDMRHNYHTSDEMKKQCERMSLNFNRYTPNECSNDLFFALSKWANNLPVMRLVELYQFVINYCGEQQFDEDFINAVHYDITEENLRSWFVACTQDGKGVACGSSWCNEGNPCDNCVHTDGRRCFAVMCQDFNPDMCDNCAIACLPCGACQNQRDTATELELERAETEIPE